MDNEPKIIEEKKKNRPPTNMKKSVKIAERQKVIDKLNNILGIVEKNKCFKLSSIDDEKKAQIDGLVKDIKKCFAYSKWTYFCKDVESPHLGLIRSLYRAVGKDLEHYIGRVGRETLYMVVDK
jgi:hypothetical protein